MVTEAKNPCTNCGAYNFYPLNGPVMLMGFDIEGKPDVEKTVPVMVLVCGACGALRLFDHRVTSVLEEAAAQAQEEAEQSWPEEK